MRKRDAYRKFIDGFHLFYRSNQCWTGLNSDIVIEQTSIRYLKSTVRVTRGSWITQQKLWTLYAPETSEYNSAIQHFTDMNVYKSSQQNDSNEASFKLLISR
ncbi:hypothetical protein DPMN_163981 [Dreissena polymorpha]|uniref:Uncharacterized protein n=1 Tax=Dreissena polymorpha TaxID=45954 RepID=A0A9D4IRU8_DREPO|nr:hypothetical protein DPMN_163981 [Dreissena polymorpha]